MDKDISKEQLDQLFKDGVYEEAEFELEVEKAIAQKEAREANKDLVYERPAPVPSGFGFVNDEEIDHSAEIEGLDKAAENISDKEIDEYLNNILK